MRRRVSNQIQRVRRAHGFKNKNSGHALLRRHWRLKPTAPTKTFASPAELGPSHFWRRESNQIQWVREARGFNSEWSAFGRSCACERSRRTPCAGSHRTLRRWWSRVGPSAGRRFAKERRFSPQSYRPKPLHGRFHRRKALGNMDVLPAQAPTRSKYRPRSLRVPAQAPTCTQNRPKRLRAPKIGRGASVHAYAHKWSRIRHWRFQRMIATRRRLIPVVSKPPSEVPWGDKWRLVAQCNGFRMQED